MSDKNWRALRISLLKSLNLSNTVSSKTNSPALNQNSSILLLFLPVLPFVSRSRSHIPLSPTCDTWRLCPGVQPQAQLLCTNFDANKPDQSGAVSHRNHQKMPSWGEVPKVSTRPGDAEPADFTTNTNTTSASTPQEFISLYVQSQVYHA